MSIERKYITMSQRQLSVYVTLMSVLSQAGASDTETPWFSRLRCMAASISADLPPWAVKHAVVIGEFFTCGPAVTFWVVEHPERTTSVNKAAASETTVRI